MNGYLVRPWPGQPDGFERVWHTQHGSLYSRVNLRGLPREHSRVDCGMTIVDNPLYVGAPPRLRRHLAPALFVSSGDCFADLDDSHPITIPELLA